MLLHTIEQGWVDFWSNLSYSVYRLNFYNLEIKNKEFQDLKLLKAV